VKVKADGSIFVVNNIYFPGQLKSILVKWKRWIERYKAWLKKRIYDRKNLEMSWPVAIHCWSMFIQTSAPAGEFYSFCTWPSGSAV
jgi:hypothetical protein